MGREQSTKIHNFWRPFCAAVLVALFVFLLGALKVDAAPKKGFEALMTAIPSGAQLTFAPGETKEVTVTFQNIGTKTWKNDGTGYVSIYTYAPKYRKSAFDPGTWLSPTQVKRLSEASVAAGQAGSFTFQLRAPETEGTYTETFHLAAEDVAWIPGGEFSLKITVEKGGANAPRPNEDDPSSGTDLSGLLEEAPKPRTGAPGYDATLLLRSAKKVVTAGGVPVTYTVGMKNAGTKPWTRREVRVPDLAIASDSALLAHASWLSTSVLAKVDRGTVSPGQVDFLTFTFTAPGTMGEHLVTFKLVADNENVEGGDIVIPVDVTSGAVDALASPIRDGVMDRAEKIPEPILRVGILIVDEETQNKAVISCDCETLHLKDENGNPLADVARGGSVIAFYKEGKYFYDAGRGLESSSFPLRFIPDVENAVLTVENFDRRATRGSKNADNQFRNILEFRHNTKKDRAWLINELSIEMYLRGLAETSNGSPVEYQKAIITAARTYAYVHWQRNTKHKAEGFMVDAWRDQVYKGYGSEGRMPRLVEAIVATRGVTVTYDGQTAITPYFSRSDGRTRSWAEVWSGDVAWLKGVSVPCDEGRTLWGHGVGMSASGAICMAEEGKEYKEILKHFYTGVDVRRDWE